MANPRKAKPAGTAPAAGSGGKKYKRKQKNNSRTDGFHWAMDKAPRIDEEMHGLQMIPAAFFTAVIIMITRMHTYERPMDQFYWSGGGNQLADFFSWFKMAFILACAVFALLFLLYRLFSHTIIIKKTVLYIPMGIYVLFVLLSYGFSSDKQYALLGWNDRFEGTLTLLSYMLMLFYIINTVRTEKGVKWIIYPVAVTSGILGLLGLTQALGHDFFRTALGKRLITPASYWPNVDSLTFTFKNNEIYQTVYNINYVSFYLTLLIPLFGLIFIHSFRKGKQEKLWKKVAWGVLFTLLIFNLIGSASSGGFLGLAVVMLLALVMLNKRLLQWWKPVAILLVLTVLMGGITYQRWVPEITGAASSVLDLNKSTPAADSSSGAGTASPSAGSGADNSASGAKAGSDNISPGSIKPTIDYFDTEATDIKTSINGNPLTIVLHPASDKSIESISAQDGKGNPISLTPINDENNSFAVEDSRFKDYITLSYAYDGERYYVVANTAGMEWPFTITDQNGVMYRNQLGKLVKLKPVEHIGWSKNPGFGSGRGYIWSRTIPMLKDHLILGSGADTYCLDFPHYDYAGKYSSNWDINMIVDKPHNMYMGAMIGTGGISLLALLVLFGVYVVQSIRLFWRSRYPSFLHFAGSGIFLGIFGFLVSAFVDDSSVSIMPLFYGLLGTGVSINLILKRGLDNEKDKERSTNSNIQ